ncbi:(Fe-S)-binding protein, partial [Thermodesulfobacteriota bacterium]
CGLCDTVCPWNHVTNFMVRKLVRQAQFGISEMDAEIWRCTTCGNCIDGCPRGVGIIDIVLALRRISSTYNLLPKSVRATIGSLYAEGNPWGGKRSKRSDFTKTLKIKTFNEDMDILYFPCCTHIYDSRARKTAIATIEILKKAGINFGILGSGQVCCGESIRKTGDEELFRRLARDNIQLFIEKGVKTVLVSSPHCYHAFKNEYTEFKINLDVIHISEYIEDLFHSGKLRFTNKYNTRVTYHDPCYLGRHNNLYDQPRKVLSMIPGLELVELDDYMSGSLCCGGGGARIWQETRKTERLSDLRLKQAVETGVEMLITCCPYCIMNFEDSKTTFPENNLIKIKDITEIVRALI